MARRFFVESPIPPVEDVELADIDLSNPFLYRQGRWQSYFERVRNEAPVHYQPNSPFGPFWSVTRHADIVAVDKNHAVFSAEPFIVIGVPPRFLDIEMFIAMDPPRHDKQRAAVQGVVAPKNLREMEGLIRSRVREVLDDLPLNEPFDWVQNVSIELTARMLATLLDFPYEQRRTLVYWSDLATSMEQANGGPSDNDEVFEGMRDMARGLSALWHDKAARRSAGEESGFDLITMLQSNEDTKDLIDRPMEFLGNLVLLIVGGERHDAKLDERWRSCVEPIPRPVREIEGQSRFDPQHELGNHPMANTLGVHAPNRQSRHRSERTIHPQG